METAGAGRRRRAGEGCGRTCHNLIPQFDDLERSSTIWKTLHRCNVAPGGLIVARTPRARFTSAEIDARLDDQMS